jgi:hypothetical protein
VWSVTRGYQATHSEDAKHPRVEAGSNTFTVTLRGDEKGSLKSEKVIYGRESQGTRLRKAALARARQTRPLVREGAPQ